MANKYHVNKETGRANICRADKKGCPLGADTPHFDNKEDAKSYIEKSEAENNDQFSTVSKKSKPSAEASGSGNKGGNNNKTLLGTPDANGEFNNEFNRGMGDLREQAAEAALGGHATNSYEVGMDVMNDYIARHYDDTFKDGINSSSLKKFKSELVKAEKNAKRLGATKEDEKTADYYKGCAATIANTLAKVDELEKRELSPRKAPVTIVGHDTGSRAPERKLDAGEINNLRDLKNEIYSSSQRNQGVYSTPQGRMGNDHAASAINEMFDNRLSDKMTTRDLDKLQDEINEQRAWMQDRATEPEGQKARDYYNAATETYDRALRGIRDIKDSQPHTLSKWEAKEYNAYTNSIAHGAFGEVDENDHHAVGEKAAKLDIMSDYPRYVDIKNPTHEQIDDYKSYLRGKINSSEQSLEYLSRDNLTPAKEKNEQVDYYSGKISALEDSLEIVSRIQSEGVKHQISEAKAANSN